MALTQVQGGMILASGQSIPAAALPVGSVLQVVSSQYNTSFTTSSASMVASGLSASITPKFSTSKILAIFSLNFTSGGANNQATTTLYRNSTNLALSGGIQTAFGQVYGSAGVVQGGTSASCLDSPATTSATTYAVYVASTNGGSITAFNNTTTGVITLMEIAG